MSRWSCHRWGVASPRPETGTASDDFGKGTEIVLRKLVAVRSEVLDQAHLDDMDFRTAIPEIALLDGRDERVAGLQAGNHLGTGPFGTAAEARFVNLTNPQVGDMVASGVVPDSGDRVVRPFAHRNSPSWWVDTGPTRPAFTGER